MQNKLNKWFEAAREEKLVVQIDKIEALINNRSTAKKGWNLSQKRLLITTLAITLFCGWLWSRFHSESVQTAEQINKQSERFPAEAPDPREISENSTAQSVSSLSGMGDNPIKYADKKVIPLEVSLETALPECKPLDQGASLPDVSGRILYLEEQELKTLGISITKGAFNYYYKTYSYRNQIKATQLRGTELMFYFVPGKPGKNYFIKPWEDDFHPLYLTDSVGNHQRNFHFQDRPEGQSIQSFNDSLRRLFLSSNKQLIPIGIRTPDKGCLELLWYPATPSLLKKLPTRYEMYYTNNSYAGYGNTRLNEKWEPIGSDGRIQLTHEELLRLGIRTDGNVLEYLNQFDTTKLSFDFNPKKTMVFAMDLKISESGGCRTNNVHPLDSNLFKNSNSAVPLIITRTSDVDYKKESYSILLNGIPKTKESVFVKTMQPKLIPIEVTTKGRGVLYVHDNTITFWYKNNQAFRDKLPNSLAAYLAQQQEFSEQELSDFIIDLNRQSTELEQASKPSAKLVKQQQDQFIELSMGELKKLNIRFNGKKLNYQVLSRDLDSNRVVIDLKVTPDVFMLNSNHKEKKKVKLKQTQLFAWYVTDSSLNINANFIDPLSQVGDQEADEQRLLNQSQLFTRRVNQLVPVLVRFDAGAVNEAKYHRPKNHLVFWFPLTPDLLNILPERCRKQYGNDAGNTK